MFDFREYDKFDVPHVGDIVKKNQSLYLIVGFAEPLQAMGYPLFQCVKQNKNQLLDDSVQDYILKHEMMALYHKVIDAPIVTIARAFDESGRFLLPRYTISLEPEKVTQWYLKNAMMNKELVMLLQDCDELVEAKRKKYLEKTKLHNSKVQKDKENWFQFFQYTGRADNIFLYVGTMQYTMYYYIALTEEYVDYIKTHTVIGKDKITEIVDTCKRIVRVNPMKAKRIEIRIDLDESDKKLLMNRALKEI